MKLIHYSRKEERAEYGIEEYVVLTEADEDQDRDFKEVTESFRRDGYEVSGIHTVEPSSCLHSLPLERELDSR